MAASLAATASSTRFDVVFVIDSRADPPRMLLLKSRT
jgi:hypothetical protein